MAASPRVLLVRPAALDLQVHAEAAGVQPVAARVSRELGDRLRGDERHRLDVHGPAGRIRLHESDLLPGEQRERVRPRPVDDPALDPVAPEVRQLRPGEADVVLDDGPVREGQAQAVGRRVPVGAHERQRPVVEAHEEAPVLADQVEAPVGGDPERLQHDLLRMVQEQALDRRDRELGDGRHGYSTAGGGSAWPHASAPPSTTTVVPVTYDAAGEARNAITAATSSGVPSRPAGIDRSHAAICSAP